MSFTDFNMPLGMKLDPNNRWVKKAGAIPWDKIERLYAGTFDSVNGQVAKPLQLALGALLIQIERKISDEEVVHQIQETPCLQYFCGLPGYVDEPPFEASLMVYFRKRLTDLLGEINELTISETFKPKESESGSSDGDGSSGGAGNPSEPSNKGDLIIDATCAPQNIRYPQDLSLLNEARENLERMVGMLHSPLDGGKPRTYRKNARRDYLEAAKSRRKTPKQLRKAIGRQLGYVRRDLGYVLSYLNAGRELPKRQMDRLSAIVKFCEQQDYMRRNRVSRVDDRIVSLGQPWVRPIVRGKAKAKCEFGAKLDISVANGFARMERVSFDAYNESENLIESIERYKQREGHYPERVLADKIYRSSKNVSYCQSLGIQILGKPLGRPRKDISGEDRKLLRKSERKAEIDRIEVERKFSHAKGSFGLGLIRTRLRETSLAAIALAILALNIAHIVRFFRTLSYELMIWIENAIDFIYNPKNVRFVQ